MPKQRLSRWRRWSRHSFSTRKISRKNIRRLTREYATDEPVLMLHPEEGFDDFPNRYVVSKRAKDNPDLLVDSQFHDLSNIPSGSHRVIVCIGLLEHIADPPRFVGELHRILAPGGRVILSCSACFSFHECPDDYFHYTPFGLRRLFSDWERFDLLRGSCGPFETLGILLQRILLQAEVFPPARPLLELAVHVVPWFDRLIIRQYNSRRMIDGETECDSMLPSNLQAVVVK